MPLTPKDGASHFEQDRVSSAERAYRALKDLILSNELPAGSQLLEQEAALRLGMSRTPVREAMIRLEQDGVVEIRPRHGMRVLPVSAADMREIYDVLTSLEATAAEMVAPAESEASAPEARCSAPSGACVSLSGVGSEGRSPCSSPPP